MKRLIIIFFMLIVLVPNEPKTNASYLNLQIFAYNPSGDGAMTQVCSLATNNSNSSRYITNYINTYFRDGSHDKSSGNEGACKPNGGIRTERLKDDFLRYKANATIYNSTVPQSGSVESKEAYFNWYN
ncbi:MAG: hypothetical protein NC393_07155 [Clostridium sp.]|nr:hypothetical protein [Clostridium sp.]MCM1171889.1 hypothetical protein [Clostridium sp.]MCM1209785.1 hypothetical protein [Ruminococcus sp.]